jgi:hypothetical protein
MADSGTMGAPRAGMAMCKRKAQDRRSLLPINWVMPKNAIEECLPS